MPRDSMQTFVKSVGRIYLSVFRLALVRSLRLISRGIGGRRRTARSNANSKSSRMARACSWKR